MPLTMREALRSLVIPATETLRAQFPETAPGRDPLSEAKDFYNMLRRNFSSEVVDAMLRYETSVRKEAIDASIPGAEALLDAITERTNAICRSYRSSGNGRSRNEVPLWACLVCLRNPNGHDYEEDPFIRGSTSNRVGYRLDGSKGNNYPEWQPDIRPATPEEVEYFLEHVDLDMTTISRDPLLIRAMQQS